MIKCPYCECDTNDFEGLNQTAEYSGIELALNRQGMLRARVLDDDGGFQLKILWKSVIVPCVESGL